MLFGLSNTRVSPDAFSQDLLSKVFNEENESIGRHPVSRVVQRTLGKYAALSVGTLAVRIFGPFSRYEGE